MVVGVGANLSKLLEVIDFHSLQALLNIEAMVNLSCQDLKQPFVRVSVLVAMDLMASIAAIGF